MVVCLFVVNASSHASLYGSCVDRSSSSVLPYLYVRTYVATSDLICNAHGDFKAIDSAQRYKLNHLCLIITTSMIYLYSMILR